jgi:hypothetical protein
MCGAVPTLHTCVNDSLNYLITIVILPLFCKHYCPDQVLGIEDAEDPLSCDGRTLGLFLIAWPMSRVEL